VDCGWQIVTNLQSVQVRTNYYYLTALACYFNSIQMPQAKTPKPVSLAVPWAMPDPVIPLHSCQPAPDLQAHKISVAVMFLTCQIADAASCLRKITNRINLWMPSHASRPSLKKKWREKANLAAQYLPCWEQHAATTHHQKFGSELVKSWAQNIILSSNGAAFISTRKKWDMMDY